MIDEPTRRLDEGALRALVPRVLAGLVRRGEDFDAAEDALQEALLEALRVWPEHPPRDPRAWLDEPELSLEELESEAAGSLPDRQAMSLIDASVTIPANPALAADVLADTLGDAPTEPDPGDESLGGEG